MSESWQAERRNLDRLTKHRRMDVDGVDVFYREAGPADGPVLLLPHGYPGSSMEFRGLMPALADRYRLLAPDFPGQGLSATPEGFDYSFDGYARFLERFAERLGVQRLVLYLHDFGSQIGLRLAILRPEWIAGLIIQNGDIYEDVLGPKYGGLKAYFADKSPEHGKAIEDAVSQEGFREEYLNALRPELAETLPPELWLYHWSLMTPRRKAIMVDIIKGLEQNLDWFGRYQSYLRQHQPPALILWGPQDGYMPEESARAYQRDLPRSELHLLDAGHWALETSLDDMVPLIRDFLGRVWADRVTNA
ncbi:alpha/beta hydrolase [Devosia neptuniae]|uniref:Alpha/beta hydrolase n=1 Tax=Devosia neptuniae TaxID=191302 RepID=A0ABY6CI89_9HYPH|nr:alpha/beta hydrolase [Devosia neptuniae]UXN71792.1 alpha/beta hydrolase [Devosia neptuniae]